ncbi:MAG: pentapeptide repeat-containing protein [Saprospiraceae bacterium]|nr:pentapeptide repeat-containing protein [Saprospiraceae bacterium]
MNNYYDEIIKPEKIKQQLEKAEYEKCIIRDFDINAAILSGYVFIDCVFDGCNLSLCKLHQTALRNVIFKNCKLLGMKWDECQSFMFSVHFENSNLDMSNFYGLRLKKSKFISCSLKEVDFTEADMMDAILDDCDCSGAVFDQTNLTNADLSTSQQYIINPTQNNVKNSKFSWPAASGLLVNFGVKIT